MPDQLDAQLRHLLEHARGLFCIAGTDGHFRWLSPHWEHVLGWSLEELCAAPFLDLVHPDDIDPTLAEVAKLDAGVTTIRFENRYRHRDGRWKWLEWTTTPRADGALFAIARDITRDKDIAREQAERARLVAMAEEVAKVGHWRVDLVENTVFWSPEVYKIHGRDPMTYTPDLAGGINAYHPDDQPHVSESIEKAIATRSGFDFELRLIRTDGSVRFVVSRGRVELNQAGEVVGILGIFMDITDDRRAARALARRTKRLEQANALLEQFAYIASHDLRTPLNGISQIAGMLHEDLDGALTDDSRELMEMLLGRIDRMHGMLDALRAFAKSERVQDHPNQGVERVDLQTYLDNHPQTDRFEITVADIPALETGGLLLEHVLHNLLDNAMRHHDKPTGRIAVRAVDQDAFVRFEIEDDGPGIPDRYHEKIFRVFQTLKPRDMLDTPGMGLAVARRIAVAQGGKLTLQSPIDADRGARFTVLWPKKKARDAAV